MFPYKANEKVFNNLLRQITIILCATVISDNSVNGKNMKTLTHLPAWQLDNLAQDVCLDLSLYLNGTTSSRCKSNFWKGITSVSSKPSSVQIKCQTETTITFEIASSVRWQLVLLIADKYTDIEVIEYSLLEPYTVFGELNTIPPGNYTIWSSNLDGSGFPYKWRRGPIVREFNKSNVHEHKDYEIGVNFEGYKNGKNGVLNATAYWNIHDDKDLCFSIVNVCYKGYIYETNVLPTRKPKVTLQRLPLNDECKLSVKGMYGSTSYEYHTPSCEQLDECLYSGNVEPEIPQNVELDANENLNGVWAVRVKWSKPKIKPQYYKLVLRTNVEKVQVLPGNATEAVFKDVIGHGIYNVSVYAFIRNVYAHTSRRSFFTRSHLWLWISAAAGAWCTVAITLTGALFCTRCRRRNTHIEYPQPQEIPIRAQIEEEGEESPEDIEVWKDQWEVRSDSVLLHETIGEGAFGVVKRGTMTPVDREVAVKMLKDFPTVEEMRSFRGEIELMKSVGVHPHVVSLVGCCTGRKPFIVVEYCSRGDLLSYLRYSWDAMATKKTVNKNNKINLSQYQNNFLMWKIQRRTGFVVNKLYDIHSVGESEFCSKDLLSFCRQIAMGMQFLAANRVIHRDLAARNILVTSERTLKIADFGLSRDVYEHNQYKQTGSGKLPLKWMALESLTRRIYTSQSDVWSFGVVMWEIVTVGGSPYPEIPTARLTRLLRSGYRMPRPLNCSKELYEVMMSCWKTQPRERPTFSELYQELDAMLSSACANEYINLDLNDDAPAHKSHNYFKMLIGGQFPWKRSNNYERSLKVTPNNYISPPILVPKIQP